MHNYLKDRLWMAGCWERERLKSIWLATNALYGNQWLMWYLINEKSMYNKLLRALSSNLKLTKILCQEFQFCIKQVVYSITRLGVALEVVYFHICMGWFDFIVAVTLVLSYSWHFFLVLGKGDSDNPKFSREVSKIWSMIVSSKNCFE